MEGICHIFDTMDSRYVRCVEANFYKTIIPSTKPITLLVWSHISVLIKNLSLDFITAC